MRGPDERLMSQVRYGVKATRRLELEPPRYCPQCRRRMVVQVTPDRWTARCAEHGQITARTWAGG